MLGGIVIDVEIPPQYQKKVSIPDDINKRILDALVKTRKLLEFQERLCKRNYFLNWKREMCDVTRAESYCLMGAVLKSCDFDSITYKYVREQFDPYLDKFTSAERLSDFLSHSQLLMILDEIISKLQNDTKTE